MSALDQEVSRTLDQARASIERLWELGAIGKSELHAILEMLPDGPMSRTQVTEEYPSPGYSARQAAAASRPQRPSSMAVTRTYDTEQFPESIYSPSGTLGYSPAPKATSSAYQAGGGVVPMPVPGAGTWADSAYGSGMPMPPARGRAEIPPYHRPPVLFTAICQEDFGLYDTNAQSEYLPLRRGQPVEVTSTGNNQWWFGYTGDGRYGKFPSSIVNVPGTSTASPQQRGDMPMQQPTPGAPRSHSSNKTLDGAKRVGSRFANSAVGGFGLGLGQGIARSIFRF
ncbi:hypothetical protein H696_04773 [Fonticula alba]|uniref:SH3 domain-containing protein n=1 Tax=Fonticula alba TaxID=691883 RepID=A0A058Z2J6_FONAL|nr:hypothetical protein H696_04773 [Fonticula alba]KCV68479.1 hypothetical protein H696_04773 [Fonticula alba]|eukprot:XP_009496911.1 hypothetical protein H696_04773 [Fonticula alba]